MAAEIADDRLDTPETLAETVNEIGHETRLMALDALLDLVPGGSAGNAAAAIRAGWMAKRISAIAGIVTSHTAAS